MGICHALPLPRGRFPTRTRYLADYLYDIVLGGITGSMSGLIPAAVYVAKEVRDYIEGVGPVERIAVFGRDGKYDEVESGDILAIEENLKSVHEAQESVFDGAFGTISSTVEENAEAAAKIMREIREGLGTWYAEWQDRREKRSAYIDIYTRKHTP